MLPPPRERDWHELWAHRADLMRIARRRTPSEQDAEDVVHEALLRAASRGLAEGEAGPWLTRVVVNLCVDLARERARQPARLAYALRHQAAVEPVDERVCDRAEASWLAAQADALPARQRRALLLRAEGLGLEDVAARLGASYKTTESLLARGRASLRARLRSTHGIAVVALLPWRWARSVLPTVGATTAAAGALFTAALLGPPASPSEPPPAPQRAAPVGQTVAPDRAPAAGDGPAVPDKAEAVAVPARLVDARPSLPPDRPAPVPSGADDSRVVLRTQDVGNRETAQLGGVTVTEEDRDESFQESLDECLAHHTADPLTLVNGTCPPDG